MASGDRTCYSKASVNGFRLSLWVQASRNIFDLGGRETPGRAEKNSAGGFFNREFGAWSPSVSGADLFRQDDLAFGGQPSNRHW